jgi:hypothetical protein
MNHSLQDSHDTRQTMYQCICLQGRSDKMRTEFTAAGKVEREEIDQGEVGSTSACLSKSVDSKEVEESSNAKVSENEGDVYWRQVV